MLERPPKTLEAPDLISESWKFQQKAKKNGVKVLQVHL